MKKSGLLFIFLLALFIIIPYVSAELTDSEKSERIDKAYDCLSDRINSTTCEELSVDQSIFSLLAVGECEDKVLNYSNNETCWPNSSCKIKTTAQAVLALEENTEVDVQDALDWLLEQKAIPNNLIWYLEIDTENSSKCTISYDDNSYEITINENKKINKNAGNCLTRSTGDYWLKISSTCQEKEFAISCEKDFITTLLFQKQNSDTINVLSYSQDSSAGGTTFEKIYSLCFAKSGVCDYEGSLWAALVLDAHGEDVSAFMPYLITGVSDNSEFMPEVFLYSLTGATEYRTKILQNQIGGRYWQASNDKYYDTALALLPFQSEDSLTEKINSQNWLFSIQEENGCWNSGNILNNAFLLYSLWPKNFNNNGGSAEYCEDYGYTCTFSSDCNGEILYDYDCSGLQVCCSEESLTEEFCVDDYFGEICNSNEYCYLGQEVSTSDLEFGETCCVDGSCELTENNSENACEENEGECQVYSCDDGYEETNSYDCEYSGDVCCMPSENNPITPPVNDSKKNKFWIWILVGLILLAIIGIVLKDKLKMLLIKFKNPKKKGDSNFPNSRPSGFPPGFSPPANPSNIPRRIMPNSPARRPMPMRPPQKRPEELDSVLKKLKEMSD
ncbi:MAG: hypothetical protein WC812_04615 [Candidatus Pacearchaeota archaeon]|jgi:hypothetical protein